jgi:hypothetical protein
MFLTILGFKYFQKPIKNIMAKQPFTSTGVQAKLAEIYALPDSGLLAQVADIRADFKAWISDNFLLDTAQSTYLAGIDQKFILQASGITATAVGGRLPISFTFPAPPSLYSSKYIITIDHLSTKYDNVHGYTVTGDVVFTIGYVI